MEIPDYDVGNSARATSIGRGAAVNCLAVVLALISAGMCNSGIYAATTQTKTGKSGIMTQNSAGDNRSTVTLDRGCIIRGPRDKKTIALEFTGGYFADGGTTILETLKKHGAKASFFFIGDFYRDPKFKGLIEQIRDEGHYLGPHSDKHPLYASWENPPKLQISKEDFNADLDANMVEIRKFGISQDKARFFIPPFEHYTAEVAEWTAERGMVLINYSHGTRSNADYMQDDDPKYVDSDEMVKSILDFEKSDPDGLNGFLLLMHVGAGPGRTRDHLYNHLDQLMTELENRGYNFKRVDELLAPAE